MHQTALVYIVGDPGGFIKSDCSKDGKTDHTFNFEVHASKDQWADELSLHLSLQVHKDGGQVPVRVVWDAGGGDGLKELGLRELPGQLTHVLVDEGTQRDAGKEALGSHEQQSGSFFSNMFRMLVKLGEPTLVCRGAAPPRFLPRPCWPPWCNPALRFLQQFQTHSLSELPSTLRDASVCREATNIPHRLEEAETKRFSEAITDLPLFLIRTFPKPEWFLKKLFFTQQLYLSHYILFQPT